MSKRTKEPSFALYCDLGTPESQRQREVIKTKHGGMLKDTCLLNFYFNRHYISERQYDAGYEFALLWNIAAKEPSITAKYFQVRGIKGDSEEALHRQQDAEIKYYDSLKAMDWPKSLHARLVFNVCINDIAATSYNNCYNRKGMEVFKEGLDILVEFYGK